MKTCAERTRARRANRVRTALALSTCIQAEHSDMVTRGARIGRGMVSAEALGGRDAHLEGLHRDIRVRHETGETRQEETAAESMIDRWTSLKYRRTALTTLAHTSLANSKRGSNHCR